MPGLLRLQWLVPGICALFLAGCNPFSEARPMMTEYLERLARVLEAPAVSLPEELPPASQLPRRRDRVLDMPELDIGMLEFLSLYGCELQYVVGEKNSVMGKVMQPVNRLRYEVRFIRAAEDCLPEVDDEELGETLAEAIASKRDSLPRAVWNATWGTEEIENLFTLSKGFYPVGEGQLPVSDLLRDLEQLNETVRALSRQQLTFPWTTWVPSISAGRPNTGPGNWLTVPACSLPRWIPAPKCFRPGWQNGRYALTGNRTTSPTSFAVFSSVCTSVRFSPT